MLLSRKAFFIGALAWMTTRNAWGKSYVAPGHHMYHWWYQKIQAELGISGCCDINSQDCGPVATYDDRGGQGKVSVVLEDGKWHSTGQARVFYVDTPDGGGHACRKPKTDSEGNEVGTFYFYCVFLPKPSV